MRKSRLSTYKQDRLLEHFVSGSTARTAAKLINVNKTTAAYYFHRLREIIALAAKSARSKREQQEEYIKQERDRAKWTKKNGLVPIEDPINLQKNEECYLHEAANLVKLKRSRGRVAYRRPIRHYGGSQ